MLILLLVILTIVSLLTNFSLEKKIKNLESRIVKLESSNETHTNTLLYAIEWMKRMELVLGVSINTEKQPKSKKKIEPMLISYEGGEA